MKTILITGSTGFIGQNVLKKLGHKYNFICLNRSNKSNQSIIYDGTYESIQNGLKDKKIDTILHLATLFKSQHKSGDITDLISSNITLGCHLLEWAMQNKIHNLINFGSYAQSIDGTNDISQNLYTTTKTAFEKLIEYYVQNFELKCLNLYLYDTYGPGDTRPKLINLIINALLKNEKLGMSPGDQEICYLYIDDVLSAIELAIDTVESLNKNEFKKYGLYNKEVVTVKNLVKLTESTLGKKLNSDFGFYPYRKNEIMLFKPRYPLLPNWQPKTKLSEGILNIVKEKNDY